MGMDHNRLEEKLDNIREDQLGVPFQRELMWERIEARMESNRRVIWWPWLVAAAILLLLVFLPFQYWQPSGGSTLEGTAFQVPITEKVPSIYLKKSKSLAQAPAELEHQTIPILELERKSELLPVLVSFNQVGPVPVQETPEKEKPHFDFKDIAMIQSSLVSEAANTGARFTVTARWQKAPELNIDYQQLKLNLYATLDQ
jgi:hypothetical protein